MRRKPAVNGVFYPDNPEQLRAYLSTAAGSGKTRVKAAVIPHAGYIYSGEVAASCYNLMLPADYYIIIAPNHTGLGTAYSIMIDGSYITPLGEVMIDRPLATKILKNSTILEDDPIAQLKEHAIEVQLPFIQYAAEIADKPFKIVPIVLATQEFDYLEEIGTAIADAISGKSAVIIASSDMNHYEDQKTTIEKDDLAIQKMIELDPLGLIDTVQINKISMCGVGPAAAAMVAAIHLGAKKASLVSRSTSAAVSGDYDRVVGYSSVVFY